MLSVVGKVFCKTLKSRLVEHLNRELAQHKSQADFKRCIDNVYNLNKGT